MSLPNEPEQRKKLNDAIDEAVKSKIRQDDEKSFQADVAERICEEIEMSKSEFNKRVSIRHKQETAPTKYEQEKDWHDSVYEENEMLKGGA